MRFDKPNDYNPRKVSASKPGNKGRALNADTVVQARRRVRAGEVIKDVAADMGVSYPTLKAATSGRSWPELNTIEPPVHLYKKWLKSEVLLINDMYARNIPASEIAQRFNVTASVIYQIVLNKEWTPSCVQGTDMPSRVYDMTRQTKQRKLTAAEVTEARIDYHLRGVSHFILAKQFDMDPSGIRRMCRGETYRELPMPTEATDLSEKFYAAKKGRNVYFNVAQIQEIARLYHDEGLSPYKISLRYGCHTGTIRRVINGRKKAG